MSQHDPSERSVQPTGSPAGRHDALDKRHAERLTKDEEFSAFYRANMRRLTGFLINQGARGTLAADIAQDTMIKAYKCWTDLHSPRAWSHTVASRGWIREKVHEREKPVDEVPELPEPTSLVPRPDAFGEWETRHDLVQILHILPPRQRQVLAWALSDFSPSEIAEQLGISPNAVSANLKKARRAVSEHLKKIREEEK